MSIRDNLPQVPWTDVMSELRSVQQSMWTTKDASGKHREQYGYESYCCGPGGSLEKTIYDGRWCVAWLNRDTIRREQQRVTETYQIKVDLCLARIERLTNRMRTQQWYHALSDQESDDEIDRMIGDEPRHRGRRRDAVLSGFGYLLLRLNAGSISFEKSFGTMLLMATPSLTVFNNF